MFEISTVDSILDLFKHSVQNTYEARSIYLIYKYDGASQTCCMRLLDTVILHVASETTLKEILSQFVFKNACF